MYLKGTGKRFAISIAVTLFVSFVQAQVNPNVKKGVEAYNSIQNEEALKYFQAAGDDGEALAMLARMYYRGDGVTANFATAKSYAEKALAKGAGIGNLILYFIYDAGDANIPANKVLAEQHLQRTLPALNELRRSIIQQIERVYEVEVKDSNSLRMPEMEEKSFSTYRKDLVFNPIRRIWARGVAYAAKDDGIHMNAPFIHMYAYLLQSKKIPADNVFTGLSLYELAGQLGYALSLHSVGDLLSAAQMYQMAETYYGDSYKANYVPAFVSVVNMMKVRNPSDYKIIDTLYNQIAMQNVIMPDCIGILVEMLMDEKYLLDGKMVFEWAMLGYRNKSTACAYYLGKMYEEGLYVFQDIDKAIKYYEDAGKFSSTSYGPLEAAKLKILMKRPDAAKAWELIKTRAAEGNARAKLYDIDPEATETSFTANNVSGKLTNKVNFYTYTPLYLLRDQRYSMRFSAEFQNNSGKPLYLWPQTGFNTPFSQYASSPAMGAGAQKHETYVTPYKAGAMFGKMTFSFKTKNASNNQYSTFSTFQAPVAALFLDSLQIVNNKLNEAKERVAMSVTPDQLVNLATATFDNQQYAKMAPRYELANASKLQTFDVWNWARIQLPTYFGFNEKRLNYVNREDAVVKEFMDLYGFSLHKFHRLDIDYTLNVSFEKLLNYDDSLKLALQRFLFTEKDRTSLQPFLQIKKTGSGQTSAGDLFQHVSVGVKYGNASMINNGMYYNIVFVKTNSAIYSIVLSRRTTPPSNGVNNTMTQAEEDALYKQARTIAETAIFY